MLVLRALAGLHKSTGPSEQQQTRKEQGGQGRLQDTARLCLAPRMRFVCVASDKCLKAYSRQQKSSGGLSYQGLGVLPELAGEISNHQVVGAGHEESDKSF